VKREIKDKQIAEKIAALRTEMAAIDAHLISSTETEQKMWRECVSKIIQLEREDAALEGIAEALKDEKEIQQIEAELDRKPSQEES